MKCGIIDLGSNTVQLTLYDYAPDGSFRPLLNQWETVGLAGYIENGVMSTQGIQAACRSLGGFKALLDALEVPSLHAFATASLRNSSNAPQVVDAIWSSVGVHVELLSGEEEAGFSFRGAMLGAHSPNGLMTDVGGGSTELVPYTGGSPLSAVSLPLGVTALFSRFVDGVLPTLSELRAMEDHIASLLDGASLAPHATLLAVGGSGRAAVKLCNTLSGADTENRTVSIREVNLLYTTLSKGDKAALRLLLKTVPDRVHTALPGLLILRGILQRCGAETLMMSPTGIREGYLLNRIIGR